MGEAQDRWEEMRARMASVSANVEAEQDEREQLAVGMRKALYDLANDMTYPVGEDGSQMNIHWLIPLLSSHLAKCGYRKHEDLAVIKQIPHPRAGGPQVAEDAVLYVPVDATGTLPEAFTAPPEDHPGDPVNLPWTTKTHITVDGDTIKGGT